MRSDALGISVIERKQKEAVFSDSETSTSHFFVE